MSIFASPADAAELRCIYTESIERGLYSLPLGSVDELELAALLMMPPVLHPAVPVECARLFVSVLEERADELSAGALSVYARLGPAPTAEAATGAVARLEVDGITCPWAEDVGTLEVVRCVRAELPEGAFAYDVTLTRPSAPELLQAGFVAIGPDDAGGRVVGAVTTETVAGTEPGAKAADFERRGMCSAVVEPDALIEDLRDALRHMVRREHPLFHEQIGDLALLDRALSGRAGSLPRPLLLHPDAAHAQRVAVEEASLAMRAAGLDPLDHADWQRWLDLQRARRSGDRREQRRQERSRRARRGDR